MQAQRRTYRELRGYLHNVTVVGAAVALALNIDAGFDRVSLLAHVAACSMEKVADVLHQPFEHCVLRLGQLPKTQ